MQVLELLPRFERCVRSSQAEASGKDAEDTDDEDFAKGAARLFVELGEAYTTMVASGQYSQTEPMVSCRKFCLSRIPPWL